MQHRHYQQFNNNITSFGMSGFLERPRLGGLPPSTVSSTSTTGSEETDSVRSIFGAENNAFKLI